MTLQGKKNRMAANRSSLRLHPQVNQPKNHRLTFNTLGSVLGLKIDEWSENNPEASLEDDMDEVVRELGGDAGHSEASRDDDVEEDQDVESIDRAVYQFLRLHRRLATHIRIAFRARLSSASTAFVSPVSQLVDVFGTKPVYTIHPPYLSLTPQ